MKKIVIAVKDKELRDVYGEAFEKDGFSVLKTDNGNDVLDFAKKESPDIMLADVNISGFNVFNLLKKLEQDNVTWKIPVVIFSNVLRLKDKKKALELDAKDYVSGADNTAQEILERINKILYGPSVFRVNIDETLYNTKELIEELGSKDAKCVKCRNILVLELTKKDNNLYQVSLNCLNCKNI